jgi:lipoyl-dependent peroxiredoxin
MPAKGTADWRGDVPTGTGSPPESVETEATVTLRPVDGKPTITKIALVTVGRVPGLDQTAFLEQAMAAKAGCPVSRALVGVPDITLEASLLT